MIDYPDLEIRDEDQFAAEAIAKTSGGLTTEIVQSQIRERQEILKLIDAGLDAPICAELTNANPSAPHTVILEAQAWMLAQMGHRINRIPEQNLIAFANIFNIERRAAIAAQTKLTFTVDAPLNTNVTIPEGTQISDAEGKYVFETISAITINYPTTTGEVLANRIVSGHTLLAPNTITEMIDAVAFIQSVTNAGAIDSGLEIESVDSVLSRVKNYQRRGERIVSAKDLEDAILEEALNDNGIVRAFPFVADGHFNDSSRKPGHTTVIAMTRNGNPLDDDSKAAINDLLPQVVGNQFVYIVDPVFVNFDVSVSIVLTGSNQQSATVAAVEQNLRNFYAASREQFGRPILRSEVIAVIEGTAGVDRIYSSINAPIIASPVADQRLRAWELPRLLSVSITIA